MALSGEGEKTFAVRKEEERNGSRGSSGRSKESFGKSISMPRRAVPKRKDMGRSHLQNSAEKKSFSGASSQGKSTKRAHSGRRPGRRLKSWKKKAQAKRSNEQKATIRWKEFRGAFIPNRRATF